MKVFIDNFFFQSATAGEHSDGSPAANDTAVQTETIDLPKKADSMASVDTVKLC